MAEGLSSAEVCRLAGITYRQLDYWDRTGALEPSIRQARGSGSQRLYSEDDLAKARRFAIVRDVGQWAGGRRLAFRPETWARMTERAKQDSLSTAEWVAKVILEALGS